MPREQFTIERFDAGIITAEDAQDTPPNAASWSVDQDPEVPQGILRGREGDEIYIDSASVNGADSFAWIVREDGKRDFVQYSKLDGKLTSIADFFGSKTVATQATYSTNLQTTIQSINRSARIGYGNNPVKYLGYIDHAQFGGSVPSGLQYVDSTLSVLEQFPVCYKTVFCDGSLFGIELQGNLLYKINISNGSFSTASKKFSSLQGITTDGTYIYVYDSNIGEFGAIFKMTSAMAIDSSYTISGFGSVNSAFGGSESGYVTDIELSSDNTEMWFSGVRSIPTTTYWNSTGSKFIFSFDLSSATDGDVILLTDRTPSMNVNGADGGFYIPDTNGKVILPLRSLIKLSNTAKDEIGILLNVQANVYYNSATAHAKPEESILILDSSFTAGGYLVGSHSNLISISITGIAPDAGEKGYLTCSVLMSPTLHGDDVLLISEALNGFVYSILCNYSGGTKKNLTLDTTYSSDWTWDASGWKTMSETDSITSTELDSMLSHSLAFYQYSTNLYFFANQTYNNDAYYATDQSSLQVGRLVKCSCDTSGIFSATVIYTKRSEIYLQAKQVSGSGSLANLNYYYKYCFIYQDSQFSPLNLTPLISTIPSTGYANFVVLNINGTISKRVTGIALFRAESSVSVTSPTTAYRLVDVYDIKIDWANEGTTNFGNYYTSVVFDKGNYGPTYESESGIPETLPNNYMRYSIATQGNGYFFVGQGYNEEFDDNSITNIIFRSKRNAPDTFDWSNDFLVLPFKPIALHFFKNFLFAFDYNTTIAIDPETFNIIAMYDGYGVSGAGAVASNNEFMVFANANNVYLHDGQKVSIISRAINISQYSSVGGSTVYTHRGLMATHTLNISFYSNKNSVALCYSLNGTATKFFIFHIPTASWYYWAVSLSGGNIDTSGNGTKSCFSGYNGLLYLSTSGGIARMATSATRKTCTWISRQFNMGDVTLIKKFIKAILNTPYGGSISTKYYSLNANTTIATAFTSGSYLSDATTKANSIWFKILITSTEQLQGLTLIYRRMIGWR